MEKVVQTIVRQIARKLGGQIEVVFLYGSLPQGQYEPGQSDINLLAVVTDGTSVHALRSLFLPVWEEYGHVLRRAPLIAQESAFFRYMQIAPTFAHHLIHDGRILYGPPDYLDGLPETNPYDATARLAWEAMKSSSALTPALYTPEIAQQQLLQLRRLARRMHGKPISKDKTAVELFALVQYHLNQKVTQLKGTGPHPDPPTTPDDFLPGLQSTYKLSEQMVMVFQNLPPHRIMGIQWPILADRLGNQAKGLQITTAEQLGMIVEIERPLDLVFLRYQHEWGKHPLDEIQLSQRQILRHAARLPLVVQIDLLPNAYLTQDDSKLHDIVHDFQNKLLNVQLEHELLCRLQKIERFVPPEPLPDRSTPSPIRIDAIFKQLGWWAEYYANEMTKYE